MTAIETVREALLDNGRIVEYDICSRDIRTVNDPKCRYLGIGTVYSINGVRQEHGARMHFWAKKRDGVMETT